MSMFSRRTTAGAARKSQAAGARGFTLVEMLISIAILGVITAFSTASFSSSRKGDELRIAGNLVATFVRRAQSAATGGELMSVCRGTGATDGRSCPAGTGCLSGDTCLKEVPRGYGVRFTTLAAGAKKMIYFSDNNGNRYMDAGEEVRTESLGASVNVAVSALAPVGSGLLDVVFEPPKPSVYFNGATTPTLATITIQQMMSGQTKTVQVNRVSGQVNLQ